MGHLIKAIRFRGPRSRRWVTVRALVDTGATHCLLPPEIARRVGLDPAHSTLRVRLAHGKFVTLGGDVGTVKIDGREAPATILIAKGAEPILGVEAMESLGVTLDVRRGKFKATRSYAVRLGGFR